MKQVINGKLCTVKDAPVNSPEERVQRLEDINSIKELFYNYAYGCDINDASVVAACFTNDCVLSLYDSPEVKGKEEVYDLYSNALPIAITGSHYMSNVQIWFDKPDSAICYAYLKAWRAFKDYPNSPDLHMYGRYEAHAVKEEDGEWRFCSYKLIAAGQSTGKRSCEQFNRPWPPSPMK